MWQVLTCQQHTPEFRRAPRHRTASTPPTMVKVEIVQEQDEPQRGASPYSSASSAASSTDSVDSISSDLPADESFLDRVRALQDIVPPTTRHAIATKLSATGGFLKRSSKVLGNIVWVVTTSALLVGLPMALSLEGEAAVIEQEKAMLAQGGGQMMPGAGGLYPPPVGGLPPAQGGLSPPGF